MMLLATSSSNDDEFGLLLGFAGRTFSFSLSILQPPLLVLELRDLVGRFIFGSDIVVVVDVVVVVVAALDGLAGGAGLEGPPAASDEAVAAA